MKKYTEHTLGGARVRDEKQFLENDRKVLKFFIFYDSPYIMHYFLADDTLEIREINYQNSGKYEFHIFLKRQQIPRKFNLNQPGQIVKEDFLKPEHIRFGESIKIYGRDFNVNGCDAFTSKYYKEHFNREFPVPSSTGGSVKEKSNIIIPPYNGFGDEEDTLGQVYRLVAKRPKKDYFKWMDNQIQLRFKARLNT